MIILNDNALTESERQGALANRLISGGFDIHSMRPWIGANGKVYCNTYVGPIHGDRNDEKNYKTVEVIANGTLLRDEWIAIDRTLIGLAEHRLGGAQHLIDRGLTMDMDGMAYTMVEWRDYSDALKPGLDMRPTIRAEADRQKFTSKYLPLPFGFIDFEIDKRELAMSRRMGFPFDTMLIDRGGRRLQEQTEERLFTDTTFTFGDNDKVGTGYSYLNHPHRNRVDIMDWSAPATTGKNIKDDVLKMINASLADNFHGPWVLYVPKNVQTKLGDDYLVGDDTKGITTVSGSIKSRIMDIDGIEDIRVIDTLPNNNVLMVSMTKDTVCLVRGLGLTTVQWAVEGEFLTHYKIILIECPMIRSTQDGKSGIVHGT